MQFTVGGARFEQVDDVPVGRGALGDVYSVREVRTVLVSGVPSGTDEIRDPPDHLGNPDEEDGPLFALKVVQFPRSKHQIHSSLAKEIRILQALRGEKHVVQLLAAELCRDKAVMLLELAAGTLQRVLDNRRLQRLVVGDDLPWIGDLFFQACLAVQAVHSRGILHLDVKPGNFLRFGGGAATAIKIADFGVSEPLGSVPDLEPLGSIPFMSPERFSGCGQLSGGADVWSLGVVLYEMIYGKTPWLAGADPRMQIMGMRRGIPKFGDAAALSMDDLVLVRVCQGCLTRDVAERWPLERVLGECSVLAVERCAGGGGADHALDLKQHHATTVNESTSSVSVSDAVQQTADSAASQPVLGGRRFFQHSTGGQDHSDSVGETLGADAVGPGVRVLEKKRGCAGGENKRSCWGAWCFRWC